LLENDKVQYETNSNRTSDMTRYLGKFIHFRKKSLLRTPRAWARSNDYSVPCKIDIHHRKDDFVMGVCHAGNRQQIVFSDGFDVISQFDTVWVGENRNGRDVEAD
jgi:hypothetical protein